MSVVNSVVAIYDAHEKAEHAIKELQEAGVDMKSLSIVAKDTHTDEHVIGYYNAGDRMKRWGKIGAFWGGFWGLLFGSAFFAIPGIGPILVAGPLVAWIIGALEGAVVVGGVSAIGAGLMSIGIPKDSVIKYDAALKTDKYLLVVHGTGADVEKAKEIIREHRRSLIRFTANLCWLASHKGVVEVVMTKNRSFPGLVFVLIVGLGALATLAMYKVSFNPQSVWIMGCAIVLAFIVSSSIQVADQWSKAVVLRLGKFHALQGPGLFFIIPLIDTIPYWIDIRVLTSSFKAEKTLTKDTVPVDVDAVLFWKIIDPKKAALDVADYQSAISWASQTALRDVIGKTMLSDMLEGRDKISGVLQKIIDERTEPWGINVISVEVKDVLIPPALENAMSMQAQAERERQARVILGDSERQVAEKFGEAAQTYINNPVALHLRAMNMLYEGLKQNSTIVIVPSSAVETMQLGGLAGLTALTMGLGQEKTILQADSLPAVSSNGTGVLAEDNLLPVGA